MDDSKLENHTISDERRSLFISFSHEDEEWKNKLLVQLRAAFSVSPVVELWHDRRISVGQPWRQEIDEALARAQAAIFLVSADFLASKFIRLVEIPKLLARHQRDGVRLLPLLVRSCPWQRTTWLSEIQMRPTDGIPLSESPSIDRILSSFAIEVAELFDGRKHEPRKFQKARQRPRSLTFDLILTQEINAEQSHQLTAKVAGLLGIPLLRLKIAYADSLRFKVSLDDPDVCKSWQEFARGDGSHWKKDIEFSIEIAAMVFSDQADQQEWVSYELQESLGLTFGKGLKESSTQQETDDAELNKLLMRLAIPGIEERD